MKTFEKALLAVAFGASVLALTGTTWNAGWEARPAGTDQASDLDLFINEFKTEVRQRLEVEHIFGPSGDDNGLHTMGSARCFVQNAAPTDINSATAALGQYNSAAGVDAGTALTTDEVGATTRDLGSGRCWIDLDGPDNVSGTPDDRSFASWDETNNIWKYEDLANSAATTLASQRFLFDPGKYNLLYNGDFSITDGTGATGGSGTPANWVLLATNPTISYTTPPSEATEGQGVQVNLLRGAGDGGIEQLVTLKGTTTYYLMARVRATGAAGCGLSTANAGGSNLTEVTTTSATYTTLSGTFVTTAGALDPLNIRVRVITGAGSCQVSRVELFETTSDRRGISQGGTTACRSTNNTSTDNFYNDHAAAGSVVFVDSGLSCTINVPGPGYMIRVEGLLMGETDVNNAGLEAQLRQNCSLAGNSIVAMNIATSPNTTAFATDVIGVPVNFLNITPTTGDQCVYTIEGLGHGDTVGRNLGGGDAGNSDTVNTPVSWLQATLIPTR